VSNLFLKRARILSLGLLTWGQAASLVAQPAPGNDEGLESEPGEPMDVAETIDALARFMAESTAGKRPTVPYPEDQRPASPVAICSLEHAICVHAEDEAAAAAGEWLAEAEAAALLVGELGFPVPEPDGGDGGTFQLDVYLAAMPVELAAGGRKASGEVGTRVGGDALLDGATAYARIDPTVTPAQRLPCAVQAIAEAGLRAQDPSESRLASGAVAAFVAYLATGAFGCVERLEAIQLSPEAGIAGPDVEALATLQLALMLISRRHDGGSGEFIREVWQLARQRSAMADALRASPTFFEALDRALKNSGESLAAMTEELGVARYFATRGEREGSSRALPALPASIGVPVAEIEPFAELPAHLPVHEPLLGPLGSGYAHIDTSGAAPGSRLDVWLRGDVGPKLVLTAVRLDAQGREVGRMTAPARRVPQSFLPIELSPDTASVLLVVTALAEDLRALGREPAEGGFAFRLILNRS